MAFYASINREVGESYECLTVAPKNLSFSATDSNSQNNRISATMKKNILCQVCWSCFQTFLVADTRLYTLPCRSVDRQIRHISELRAVFASMLLPNRPRLDCRVSGLVFSQFHRKAKLGKSMNQKEIEIDIIVAELRLYKRACPLVGRYVGS